MNVKGLDNARAFIGKFSFLFPSHLSINILFCAWVLCVRYLQVQASIPHTHLLKKYLKVVIMNISLLNVLLEVYSF